ncbi:DUF202 domain-containing protein [Streptomyces sp. NPDC091292]|uniref:DUF202 domain-containing protein n=1 Tax=Streptomyces sp. NPDC091292 TaxID=3365991 RepID=UPI0037FF971C
MVVLTDRTGRWGPTRGRCRAGPRPQPERTRPAWRRTTLTYTVAAVLAGRQVVRHEVTAVRVVAAALSALVWAAFLWVADRRIVALNTPRPCALPMRAGGGGGRLCDRSGGVRGGGALSMLRGSGEPLSRRYSLVTGSGPPCELRADVHCGVTIPDH